MRTNPTTAAAGCQSLCSAVATTTVENYLKRIYLAQQDVPADSLVAMGELAAAAGVTPGTATTMVKSLEERGLLDYTPRGGVRLTTDGEALARQVLRRHRLIEQFLVEVVGLDWSEVHDEAEVLEHAVSDKLLERIDALLGRPHTDPHGDPIPPADGRRRRRAKSAPPAWSLADCPPNRPLRVCRVLDQTPDFLRFLRGRGLVPGATASVVTREPASDSTGVHVVGHGRVALGTAAATKVLVDEPT